MSVYLNYIIHFSYFSDDIRIKISGSRIFCHLRDSSIIHCVFINVLTSEFEYWVVKPFPSVFFCHFYPLHFFSDHDEAIRIDSDNDEEVSRSEGERFKRKYFVLYDGAYKLTVLVNSRVSFEDSPAELFYLLSDPCCSQSFQPKNIFSKRLV